MTKKQIEVLEIAETAVQNGYGTDEVMENGNRVITVKYQSKFLKDVFETATLIITGDEMIIELNSSEWKQPKQYERAYKKFIDRVNRIIKMVEDDIEKEKREKEFKKQEKEYYQNRQQKILNNWNDPETFKNDYLDKLLDETKNQIVSYAMNTVLHPYLWGRKKGNKKLIIPDMKGSGDLYYNEINEILETAGINEFILTESSSGLMEALTNLMDRGWKVKDSYHFTKKAETEWDVDEEITGIILNNEA